MAADFASGDVPPGVTPRVKPTAGSQQDDATAPPVTPARRPMSQIIASNLRRLLGMGESDAGAASATADKDAPNSTPGEASSVEDSPPLFPRQSRCVTLGTVDAR